MRPRIITVVAVAGLMLAATAKVCLVQGAAPPQPSPQPKPPLPPSGPIPPGRAGSIGGVGVVVGDGPAPDSLLGGKEVVEPDPRVRFEKLMAMADNFYLAGKYYEAVQTLGTAQALATDASQLQTFRKSLCQLDAVGQEWLAKYQQAYEGRNYPEALKGLGLVQRTFGTLPCGLAAGKLLKQAEADPAVKIALMEVKAQEMDGAIAMALDCPQCRAAASGPAVATQPAAPARYRDATRVAHIKKAVPDRQARAVSTLEKMAKLYGQSPSGAHAAKDLKELQEDAKFWAAFQNQLAAQQAQSLYNAAEMYRSMGMTAKAIEYYEQVTAKFPNSALATKAKEAIARLK